MIEQQKHIIKNQRLNQNKTLDHSLAKQELNEFKDLFSQNQNLIAEFDLGFAEETS